MSCWKGLKWRQCCLNVVQCSSAAKRAGARSRPALLPASEGLARGDPEDARLADAVTDAHGHRAFAIEREQRILIEDIVDIRDQRQAIVEVDPALRLTS